MLQSVLGSITLGYRPLWGKSRDLSGIQLFVGADPAAHVDAPHLLRTLDEMWSDSSPPLLMSFDSPDLLLRTLEKAPASSPLIEVNDLWLDDPVLGQHVIAAWQRGVRMIWRGNVRHIPNGDFARCFTRYMLSLQPEDAAAATQAALQQKRYVGAPSTAFLRSPVLPGHFYEDIANATLIDHCLDQKQAIAIAGWPDEEVRHAQGPRELAPARSVIERLLKAIKQDQSIEVIEDILGEEPLLCYRFLTMANSASLGLRTGVDSLRRGLMMMGYTTLEKWLVGQLPLASTAPDLQPLRIGMVLRALLMEQLLEAGVETELRREVYLCGLFSQLDLLMGDNLAAILNRLPLSDRIHAANVTQSGPYLAPLDLARALAEHNLDHIRRLRHAHELEAEDVNRALLRMLVGLRVPVPAPLR